MIRTRMTGAVFIAVFALCACGATPANQRQSRAKPREVEIPVSKFPGDIPPGTPLPIPKGMQHLPVEKVLLMLSSRTISSPSPNGQNNWDFDNLNHRVLRRQTGGIVPYNRMWPYVIENDGRICLRDDKSTHECFYFASNSNYTMLYMVFYSKEADKKSIYVRYSEITLVK